MDVLFQLESAILLFLQNVRSGPLSAVLVPLTTLVNHGELWLTLSAVLLCFPRTRKAGALALLSMLLCWGSSELILKNLVQRPRPFTLIEGLTPLVAPPHSFSFPSGHTCSSLAAAGTHWRVLKDKRLRWGILITALLVGFSRLYVGVHFPTDVVTAGLLGWFGSALVVRWASPAWDKSFGGAPKDSDRPEGADSQ